eukprot:gene10142-2307_t
MESSKSFDSSIYLDVSFERHLAVDIIDTCSDRQQSCTPQGQDIQYSDNVTNNQMHQTCTRNRDYDKSTDNYKGEALAAPSLQPICVDNAKTDTYSSIFTSMDDRRNALFQQLAQAPETSTSIQVAELANKSREERVQALLCKNNFQENAESLCNTVPVLTIGSKSARMHDFSGHISIRRKVGSLSGDLLHNFESFSNCSKEPQQPHVPAEKSSLHEVQDLSSPFSRPYILRRISTCSETDDGINSSWFMKHMLRHSRNSATNLLEKDNLVDASRKHSSHIDQLQRIATIPSSISQQSSKRYEELLIQQASDNQAASALSKNTSEHASIDAANAEDCSSSKDDLLSVRCHSDQMSTCFLPAYIPHFREHGCSVESICQQRVQTSSSQTCSPSIPQSDYSVCNDNGNVENTNNTNTNTNTILCDELNSRWESSNSRDTHEYRSVLSSDMCIEPGSDNIVHHKDGDKFRTARYNGGERHRETSSVSPSSKHPPSSPRASSAPGGHSTSTLITLLTLAGSNKYLSGMNSPWMSPSFRFHTGLACSYRSCSATQRHRRGSLGVELEKAMQPCKLSLSLDSLNQKDRPMSQPCTSVGSSNDNVAADLRRSSLPTILDTYPSHETWQPSLVLS